MTSLLTLLGPLASLVFALMIAAEAAQGLETAFRV